MVRSCRRGGRSALGRAYRSFSPRAFTLVELLVVIGIIALLISMLLPTLGRVRDQANGVKCSSNLRQLVTACLMFAQDHKGRLPGNENDQGNPDPEKRAWNFTGPGGIGNDWRTAPQTGTLWKYVKSEAVYLCPSRVPGAEGITPGPGYSNGKFDYSMVKAFSGARTGTVPGTSVWDFRQTSGGASLGRATLQTPYVVEETARYINLSNIDGGFSNVDEHSDHHGGGSYYGSHDGSVHYFVSRKKQNKGLLGGHVAEAWQWITKSPGRGYVYLGEYGTPWGWWEGTSPPMRPVTNFP